VVKESVEESEGMNSGARGLRVEALESKGGAGRVGEEFAAEEAKTSVLESLPCWVVESAEESKPVGG